MVRGGSQGHISDNNRVARRNGSRAQAHSYASTNVGFRLSEWCNSGWGFYIESSLLCEGKQ